MQNRLEVNEDGQLVVVTALDRTTLTRKQSEILAVKVLESNRDLAAAIQTMADAMRPAMAAVSKLVDAINKLPPDMRAALIRDVE